MSEGRGAERPAHLNAWLGNGNQGQVRNRVIQYLSERKGGWVPASEMHQSFGNGFRIASLRDFVAVLKQMAQANLILLDFRLGPDGKPTSDNPLCLGNALSEPSPLQ